MSNSWRVLDFSNFDGVIRYQRGALLVDRRNDEQPPLRVPLAEVAVVLLGIRSLVSGAVLAKLAEYDIAVMTVDWRGLPTSAHVPWREHSRIAARQRAQASLKLPRQKRAWQELIIAKIKGQSHTLKVLDVSGHEELYEIARSVKSGDSTNCEAIAARRYWHALGIRRDYPSDENTLPINAKLNYAYVVLRGYGIRAVAAAGLAPALGIFHRQRDNQFALVDDLIEPFRPAVDTHVFRFLPLDDDLDADQKKKIVGIFDTPFDKSGATIPNLLVDLAQAYGIFAEGGDPNLFVPPVWRL
ncbi:MAG: type II CRISPR-associated endonuclease Cas1 [Corynebacterium sp.]|nr:type II CRISPR-associated endonuclease Cas1 [Corynebacterium sp.]